MSRSRWRFFAAAVLSLTSGSARAAEEWKLQLLGCTDAPSEPRPQLTEALALELGAPSEGARYSVRVRWPCDASAVAIVSVEDEATRLESKVDLGAQPTELWDRVVALVARHLLHDVKRVGQASSDVAASVVAASPPRESGAEELPPPPVRVTTSPSPSARPDSAWTGRVSLGSRMYPALPTMTVGGGLEAGWRWARLALSVDWTRVEPVAARVDGLILAAQLGALPFRWRQESWQIGVGAFVEGGVAHSSSHPKATGYTGTTATVPLGGASVRTELGFRPSQSWALILSLDVGYDIGLRVNILKEPAADLGGAFVMLRLGVEL